MSNRNLTIVLMVLLAIYGINKFMSRDDSTSFEKVVINIDTSRVDRLVFYPKNQAPSFSAERSEGTWLIRNETVEARANPGVIQSILGTLARIEIKRIVAKSEDKWTNYEVDEEKGFRISIFDGDQLLDDLFIGRFNFNQQTRSATSYLRKQDGVNTYALDGFLSMSLSQSFDGLRDKTILQFDGNALNAVVYRTGEVETRLSKNASQWFDNQGNVIDSTAMYSYINGVSSLSGSKIVDAPEEIGLIKECEVAFSTSSGQQVTVNCYRQDDVFLLESSENTGVYFESDSAAVYQRLIGELENLFDTY